ncbi:sporulation protein YunB [Paenibacillus soyae]|uniref:Sporulation protein YunB n=1 Tax=Paenibacillus soyae TaxID=2969249 RepID=A0A9X2S8E2_9BACL|nr:sporulation protein YunB [Paenibacillus soyae]MCR2802328.1 sporulation protein YunB [Paenibacillus soyae]
MARWGRKGWRFRPARSWGSFRRTKTISWGSGRPKSSATRNTGVKWGSGASRSTSAGGGWGTRPAAAKSGGGWRRRGPLFSFNFGGPRKAQVSSWGSKPNEPRPRRKMRKRNLLLIMLVCMLLFFVPSFIFIESNLKEPLMNIARVRVKQVATQAINKAISEQVARKSESEKLIDWKMNGDGKISGFMLNYAEHMSITSETIETVQNTFSEIKDIPEHIPIGHALNSAIISSFGPRVPVKFEPVGAVKVELNTRERNAAINMVLVEVYIKVVAEVSIIIPFDSEPELVETEIPISYLMVVGDVPMYYYDSSGKPVGENAPEAPNISVPLSPGGSGVTTSPGESSEEGTEIAPDPGAPEGFDDKVFEMQTE